MQNSNKKFKKGKIGDRFRIKKIDNQNIKQKNKKEYTKILLLVLFLLTLTIGTSYAFFTTVLFGEKTNIVVAGIFNIEYKDGNELVLDKIYPMTDAEGMTLDSYEFSIKNTGNVDAKYNVSLEEIITDGSAIDKKYIKYSYKRGQAEWSEPALLSDGLILETGKNLNAGDKIDYELKLWLSSETPNEAQGKTFSAKVVISAVQSDSNAEDVTSPIIKLNGESTINVAKGTLFVDPGVESITDENDTLQIANVSRTYEYFDGENTIEVDEIDTSKAGIYYVYYRIKDSEGNEGCTVRTIVVYNEDNSVPVIAINGDDVIYLNVGDEYTELSATAMDNEDGNITDKIVVSGTVNTKVPGTYIVKYVVEDKGGNTSSAVRTVIVNKKGSISIKVMDYDKAGKEINVPIEIVATDGKVTGYYVSKKNDDTKPQEKDYQQVTEETFAKTLTFNENGTYYIWAIDSNYNVTSTSVEISGVDSVRPICTFDDVSYIELEEDTEIGLTCTDNTDVEFGYLLDTDFIINNTDVVSIESVNGPEKVEKGYKYTLKLKGLKKGKFNISLKPGKIGDIYGNLNEKVTKEIEISKLIVEFASYSFERDKKEASSISYTNKVGELSYYVEDPTIASVDSTGFVTGLKVGETYIIVSDSVTRLTTRIPITIEKTLVATYKTNGIGVTRINDLEEVNTTCKLTSESPTSCEVQIPYFDVKAGYSAIGFSQNKNATSEDVSGVDGYVTLGNKVSISENTSFYTITRLNSETYTANFKENGATIDGDKTKTCTTTEKWNVVDEDVENNSSKCSVTAPTIVEGSNTNTPIVVGFTNAPGNDDEAKKATEATLSSGGELVLTREDNNKSWYAITKSAEKQYIATYEINEIGLNRQGTLENINDVNTTCTIDSTYNGEKQAESCKVVAPKMVANNGYTALGWSKNADANAEAGNDDKEATDGYIKSDNDIVLKGNTTLHSIFKKKSVTLTATFRKSGYPVEQVSSLTATCSIAESFNNDEGNGSCTITVPNMTVKDGYTKIGWSKNPNANQKVSDSVSIDEGYVEIGDTLTLTEDVILYSISKKDAVTYTATFQPNGALLNDNDESIDLSCTIPEVWNSEQDSSCSYEGKTPTISREGFNIIGFDTDRNATAKGENTIDGNSDITLSSNKTYYAISNKLITIKWEANGSTISSTSSSCTIYNNSNECSETITVPTISREGYTIKGWSTDENAQEGDDAWEVGTQKKLTASDSSKTLYAITEKTINSKLDYYDPETGEVKSTELSCKIYNNQTEEDCEFDVPDEITTGTGPADTNFKEFVQDENDPSKYYALYESEIDVTFNYYDGEKQASVTNKGVRQAIVDGSDYSIKEGNVTIPDVVKNSEGINGATYKGISKDVDSSTATAITTANSNYYAYYENTLTATFNNQNSDIATVSIDTTDNVGTLSCQSQQTTNGLEYTQNDCQITLPTINVSNDYIVTGWSTDQNALDGSKDKKININSDSTYYTIIGKPAINKTATFYLNGAGKQTNKDGNEVESDVDRTCTIEEIKNIKVSIQADSCTITTPEVTGSTNTPIVVEKAYATTENAIMGTIDQNSEITISGGERYYAITTNEEIIRSANFHKNGALNQIYAAGNDTTTSTDDVLTINCKILKTYNGVAQAKSCEITAPKITGNTNTPVEIGYSKASDSHQKVIDQNETISLEENVDYYAQTRSEGNDDNGNLTFTINDYKIGSGVSSIGENQVKSCTINATYNGEVQAKSCDITAPTITPKKGYTTAGWSLNDDDTTGVSIITLNKDNNDKNWYANAVANGYTIEYYDEDTKKGSSSHKVGSTPFELTTANELGLSKAGYKFKGWATSNGGDVVYTNGQSIDEDLATNVDEVVKLYAVWKDEEKPVCSFSGTPTIKTQDTATLTLTCTDNGSGISSQGLSEENFTISEGGAIESVSDPTEVTNGFSYEISVRGLGVGNFKTTLKANSIKDNSENYNDEVTSDNIKVEGHTYTITFTKGDGVSTISSTRESCTTEGSSLTCSIANYPTITPLDGYVAGTWYDETKGVDTGITSGGNGSSYLIGGNTTMRAQTKVIPTITMEDKRVTYTGSEMTHSATSDSDGNITYEYYDGLTCSGNKRNSAPIDAGDYSVKAIQEASGNYTSASKCAKLIINKANGWVTLVKEQGSVNYGTVSHAFEIEDPNGTHGGALSVTDNNDKATVSIAGNVITISNIEDIDVGTDVIVTVTSAATDNYTEGEKTYKLSIVHNAATCPTSIEGYTGVYDGENHGITVSNDAVGGTIEYSTDNNTWSSTKPTFINAKDAGTYKTYVRVKGDSNHSNVECGSKDVKIDKATITVIPNSNQSKTYGTPKSEEKLLYSYKGNAEGEIPNFTGSLSREDGEDAVDENGNTIKYKILKGDLALANSETFNVNNYNELIVDETVEFTIIKKVYKDPENPDDPEIPVDIKVTLGTTSTQYTGSQITPTVTVKDGEKQLTINKDYTVSYGENKNVGKGTVTVTFKGNYDGEITKEFDITKAEINPTVKMQGYTYGGEKSTPSVTDNPGNGAVTYYYGITNANSGGFVWTDETILNKGTYYMYAIVEETDYYLGETTEAVEFVVSPGTIKPILSMEGYTYGEEKSIPSVTGNIGNGNVEYYYGTTDSTNDVTEWTPSTILDAGTYYMHAIVRGTTNYNGNSTPIVKFVVDQRAITVTAANASKIYDGSALTSNECTASTPEYELVSGHTITCTNTGTITNVGSATNTVSTVTIKDASGNNVTSNYTITKKNGTLTVNQRAITVTAASTNKKYDGSALTSNGCTAGKPEYELVNGHTIACTNTGSQTVPGSSSNTVSTATIKDSSGNNVTSNYSITKKPGTLTVSNADFTSSNVIIKGTNIWGETLTAEVTTNPTANYTYQWYATKNNATSGGTKISGATSSTYTISSDYANDYYIYVVVAAEKQYYNTLTTISDITDATNNGTAKVGKKAITCTTDSASKTYDGSPLTKNSGSCTGLASGHTATVTATGAITNAGSTANTFGTATIKSGTTDVTSRYSITKKTGTLTVNKRAITVTAGSSSKPYDGNPLSSNACTAGAPTYELVSGHTVTCTNTGSITNAGSTTNTVSTVTIKSGTTDVTSNYEITKKTGTLTVTKATVADPIACVSVVYNGSKQTIATAGTATTLSGHQQTAAGDYTVTATINNSNYQYNSSGATTTTKVCPITQRNITVTAASKSKVYDGNPLSSNECAAGAPTYGLVSGHTITCTNTGSQTNYGRSNNTVSTVTIKDASGNNVTGNYSITKQIGILNVTQRNITVTAASKSKPYDGDPLSSNECTAGAPTYDLVSGHTITCTNTGSQTDSGSTTNTVSTVTIKSGTTDVTSNYSITKKTGTLTVSDATKIVDWFANGHTLSVPSGCSKIGSTNDVRCSCTYGNSNGCTVSTPTISSPDSKYTITSSSFNSSNQATSTGTRTAEFKYYNGSAQATTNNTCIATNVGTCYVNIPSSVTGSKYTAVMPYVAVAASPNEKSNLIPSNVPSGGTYYAVYKTGNQSVRYYYQNSTYTNNIYESYAYSNGSSYASTACTAVNETSMKNSVSNNPPSGYSYYGLSSSVNSSTLIDTTTACKNSSTFYAVYSKPISVSYAIGTGVSSIGKTSDQKTSYHLCQSSGNYSYTSPKFTLPSITPKEGYSDAYWLSSSPNSPGYELPVSNSGIVITAYAKDKQLPQIKFNGLTWDGSISDNKLIPDSNIRTSNVLKVNLLVSDNSGSVGINGSVTNYQMAHLEIGTTRLTSIEGNAFTSCSGNKFCASIQYGMASGQWSQYSGQNIRVYITNGLFYDGSGNYNTDMYVYAMPLGSSNSYYTVY